MKFHFHLIPYTSRLSAFHRKCAAESGKQVYVVHDLKRVTFASCESQCQGKLVGHEPVRVSNIMAKIFVKTGLCW